MQLNFFAILKNRNLNNALCKLGSWCLWILKFHHFTCNYSCVGFPRYLSTLYFFSFPFLLILSLNFLSSFFGAPYSSLIKRYFLHPPSFNHYGFLGVCKKRRFIARMMVVRFKVQILNSKMPACERDWRMTAAQSWKKNLHNGPERDGNVHAGDYVTSGRPFVT